MDFLDRIRPFQKTDSIRKQILITVCMLLLGIVLGTFSKFLDYRHGEFPLLLQAVDQALDFHNFLGGFAPWIVIAVCISVYSHPVPSRSKCFFLLYRNGGRLLPIRQFRGRFFPEKQRFDLDQLYHCIAGNDLSEYVEALERFK